MAANYDMSGYRVFSKPFNTNQGSMSFGQIYDKDWVWENGTNNTVTGAWRPLFPSDLVSNISLTGETLSVNVAAVAVTGVAAVTGDVTSTTLLTGLGYLNSLTLQNQTLLQAISGGTANTNNWKMVNSSGYVQSFSPIVGKCTVNKINGYSKCPQITNFIQIFDNATGQAGTPVAQMIVQSGNNFFYEFSSNQGVMFNNGVTISNSNDPLLIQTGSSDFVVSVVYKSLV